MACTYKRENSIIAADYIVRIMGYCMPLSFFLSLRHKMIFYLDVYRIRLLSFQSDFCSQNQYNRVIRRILLFTKKYILDIMRLVVKGQKKIIYEYSIRYIKKKSSIHKTLYSFSWFEYFSPLIIYWYTKYVYANIFKHLEVNLLKLK